MLRRVLLTAFVVSFTVLVARAQTPKPTATPPDEKVEGQEPVKVFTEEVRLSVAASDSFGHYDPSLEIDDVLVLEDGKPQQIRSIQHLPANVLLLLDVGNQLGLKNTNVTREVALRVVAALRPGNRIAIMQFAERAELLQAWTNDKALVAKVLKTKLQSGKTSRLSDALATATDQFKEIPAGTRHIVLVTDGVEGSGRHRTMAESLDGLYAAQVSVHVISYTILVRQVIGKLNGWRKGDGKQRDGNPASNPVANGDPTLPPGATRTPKFTLMTKNSDPALKKRREEYERATRFSEAQLSELAEESGGQIWLPTSIDDLTGEAEDIARDIGTEYVVTYRPSRSLASAKSGEYRKLSVASRRVGLYLRGRRGYVVP